MNIGMFWRCTLQELPANIQAAAEYYERKYGKKPNLCLLNVSVLSHEKTPEIKGLTIRTSRFVLPKYLWIGVEEMPTAKEPA